MNDQYDLYCFQKLGESVSRNSDNPYDADEIDCACADYLIREGHDITSNHLIATQVIPSAEQLLPTPTK